MWNFFHGTITQTGNLGVEFLICVPPYAAELTIRGATLEVHGTQAYVILTNAWYVVNHHNNTLLI